MTRQQKTPRQRAEEQLAVADRAVKRLSEKKAALQADIDAVRRDFDQAVARRDYLAKHPDLPKQATTTPRATQSSTDQAGDTTP